jgi:TM2 domain-containing membrane protein YozV
VKSKMTAAILAFFLGGIGAHKFYLGQTGMGLMYLLFCWTGIPAMVALIEFIMLLLMDENTFNMRFNGAFMGGGGNHNQNTQAQNITINVPSGEASPAAAAPSPAVDIGASLAKLNDLRVQGVLTEEEFTAQKEKLLSQA